MRADAMTSIHSQIVAGAIRKEIAIEFGDERFIIEAQSKLLEFQESPEEDMIQKESALAIKQTLATLTPREERVITMRFGLEDGKEKTYEEVGNLFGVVRERIRQIEAKALRKLRHPARRRHIKNSLDR